MCTGVGFAVFSKTVIDKKMLQQMGTMLAAGGSAAFTSILAYSAYTMEAATPSGMNACALSPTQIGVMQTLMAGNETCSCEYLRRRNAALPLLT